MRSEEKRNEDRDFITKMAQDDVSAAAEAIIELCETIDEAVEQIVQALRSR